MLKSSLIYLMSSTLSKLVPFLLLPILTTYLTPSEYGVISIVQVVYSINLAFLGGVQSNIPKAFLAYEKNRFAKFLSSIILVLFVFFFISLIIYYSLFFALGEALGVESTYLAVMPFIAFWSMVNLINLTLIRSQEKPLSYSVWEVGHALINVVITLILVIVFEYGVAGRLHGIFVPMLIFGVFGIFILNKKGFITTAIKAEDVKHIFKVSIPLIPHTLAMAAIALSDTFMIAAILGSKSVGIYSVGYQFGMVIMMLTDAFSKAWQPIFYRYFKNGENSKILKVQIIYLVVLPIIAVIYTYVSCFIIPLILGDAYASATEFIPVVVSAYVAMGIYQLYFPYLILFSRTNILMIITPAVAIVNILLNYIFIPRYGAIAAAYTTLLSYMCIALSLYVIAVFLRKKNGSE